MSYKDNPSGKYKVSKKEYEQLIKELWRKIYIKKLSLTINIYFPRH